jgi:hypothetical protein
MTKSLAPTTADLKALLDAEGDYVAAYNALVKSVGAELTATAKRSTIGDRLDAWRKGVVGKLDRGVVAKMNKMMTEYPKVVRAQTVDLSEPRLLDQTEIDAVTNEALRIRDLIEVLTARKDFFVRAAVNGHVDTEAAAAGDEFPEYASGRLTSTLGYDLCREAGDPVGAVKLDEDGLVENLPDEVVSAVVDEEVVVTRTVNISKLMEAAAKDPSLMPVIQAHLVNGKPRLPRHVIRATPTK